MILAAMLAATGMLSRRDPEPDLDPEPSKPPPPDPDPDPDPDDRPLGASEEVLRKVLEDAYGKTRGVVEIDEHDGMSDEALRKLLENPTTELEAVLEDALSYGLATQRVPVIDLDKLTTRGIEIGEHLPTRITGVLRETYDTPDNLTLLESSAHVATVRFTGADRYRLHGDFKQVEYDVHQGNPFGKTTADLRRLTEGFTALGNATLERPPRVEYEIPERAHEVDKAVRPAPWGPTYAPFYTPAELAARRVQAKAKKAKRKSAQASKRRNRA